MKVALAQINSYLGDFQGNCKKIVEKVKKAKGEGYDLVIFPEMTVFGYHPCDLMERTSCIDEQLLCIDQMLGELPSDIACIVGAATKNSGRGKAYFNSALFIEKQKIVKQFNKQLLPVYDVFDDSRHFCPGKIKDNFIKYKGQNILVLICEDMWGWDPIHQENPIIEIDPKSCDLVINLSASPFTLEKRQQREVFARKTVLQLQAPLVYVNMVGGQDELIFDGGSFAMNASGEKIAQAQYFCETTIAMDISGEKGVFQKTPAENIEYLHEALVLGIRDFIFKTGFTTAHLGLSGGIDSALVASLASTAIDGKNLTAVALPSKFSSQESSDLAKELSMNLGCEFANLPIQNSFDSVMEAYETTFGPKKFSLVHENVQARLRGINLMALANEKGSMLLTAGNKSEYATGYTTLYGDMCGGLAPIADLLKGEIYELCHYINRDSEIIPQGIIDREPSAELRPNQKDSDSLPEYSLLDDSVDHLVCHKEKPKNDLDKWVLNRLMLSEFKRWQAPPILKVSQHAFGQGRRMPIAHKAHY